MVQIPLVHLEAINKSFDRVRANKDVNLFFYPGKIKALLGENGAGKSTLMSILAGRLQPDSGRIIVNGKELFFRSPKDAYAAGIGMVYQHFMLIESLSVAENVLLGQEKNWLISPALMQRQVNDLARRYGIELDPAAKIADLSMGERQRVEILKLLLRESQLLIFDEPTAVLTPQETVQLFSVFQRMASLGKSVVFISHKLKEVLEIADEVAILRCGEIVDEFDRAHIPDASVLARRMIGRDLPVKKKRQALSSGEVVLALEDVSLGGAAPVNIVLRKGEILAVAGVAGNGQKELVTIVAGLRQPDQGRVFILGRPWHVFFPQPPQVGGMAYIPEDRQGVATCPNLNLVDNLLLTARVIFTDTGLLSRAAGLAALLQIIKQYDIRPGDPQAAAGSLSGGNLQKLVIARELLRQPALIIAENPTQGLDVAASEEVWSKLLEARLHAGILLVTGDVGEALQLADRIAVMYRGTCVDCFELADERKLAAVASMMAGVWGNPAH